MMLMRKNMAPTFALLVANIFGAAILSVFLQNSAVKPAQYAGACYLLASVILAFVFAIIAIDNIAAERTRNKG